jgi:hypothetical protein
LSNLVGEAINPALVSKSKDLKDILESIWSMKLSWRFRVKDEDNFGKYLFHGEEYREIEIPYGSFNRSPSPYHRIFLSFGSKFENAQELEDAEKMLSDRFSLFAEAYDKVRIKVEGASPG